MVSQNPKIIKTKNGRKRIISKCAVCDSKYSKYIKEQEASRFLSNLEIKTLLTKIPILSKLMQGTKWVKYKAKRKHLLSYYVTNVL